MVPAVTAGSDTNGVSVAAGAAQHGEAEARTEEGQDRARPGSKKSASLAIDTARPGDHQTVQADRAYFSVHNNENQKMCQLIWLYLVFLAPIVMFDMM